MVLLKLLNEAQLNEIVADYKEESVAQGWPYLDDATLRELFVNQLANKFQHLRRLVRIWKINASMTRQTGES